MSLIKCLGVEVVAIYVSDLEEAKNFYCQRLGFIESQKMDPGVVLKAGDTTFYLEGGRTKRSGQSLQEAETCVCLAVESIQSAFQTLDDNEVTIVTPYKEYSPDFAMFRISDPAGNVIEFAGKP
jgi:lactoylglutathione lyase